MIVSRSTLKRRVPSGALITLAWMIGVAWVLELVDLVYPAGSLTDSLFGMQPRSLTGLIKIPTSPFAHGGLAHLMGNTLPWIVLGGLTSWSERQRFLQTTLLLIIISGLGTWIIGRQGVHLGASGLIYGYMGYVVARAFYMKKPMMVFAGVIAIFLFAWMIFGLLPTGQAISWEGHLAGMVGGVFLARYRRLKGF